MTDDLTPDPELERLLRSRTGGTVEVTAAREAVIARAGAIRRRRAAAGSVSLVAIVVVGVALLPRGGDGQTPAGQIEVPGVEDDVASTDGDGSVPEVTDLSDVDDQADVTAAQDESPDDLPGRTSAPVDPSPSTTTAADRNTTSVPVVVSATTTTTPSESSQPTITTAPTTTTAPPSTTAGPTTTVADTTTSEPDPPIAPFTKTYESLGGSVSIRWNGEALELLSVSAASGFAPEIEQEEPLRIRVRFRGDVDDSRIEVRISDGALIENIS